MERYKSSVLLSISLAYCLFCSKSEISATNEIISERAITLECDLDNQLPLNPDKIKNIAIICSAHTDIAYKALNHMKEAFEERYWSELFYGKENGKFQLNLWRANEIIFEEAGILKEHYSTTNICTCCNPGYLFSHRASHGKRGNLGAFLQLKP